MEGQATALSAGMLAIEYARVLGSGGCGAVRCGTYGVAHIAYGAWRSMARC